MSNENDQRVAFVTGATGAIGAAIAKGIAEQPNYKVVLVVRNEAKAKRTVKEIVMATGNQDIMYQLCDLSRRREIYDLAERWQGRLDVLVNNAAVTPRRRRETPEGIELQFATNVLGYFWMIRAFKEHLKDSAPARVVNVASYWAGDLDIDDLEFERRPYRNGTAYRQSKQADRMLTAAFAQRLRAAGITVNACHPGDVYSKLSNNLGFGGSETPEQGAATPVWLATNPKIGEKTGKYFANKQQQHDRFAEDEKAVEKLFQACLEYDSE